MVKGDGHECDNPLCGCHCEEISRVVLEKGHDFVTYLHPDGRIIETDEFYDGDDW